MKKYIFYNVFVFGFLVYYLFSSGFIDKVFHSNEKEEIVKFQSPMQVQSGAYPKEFINCIFNMKYYGRQGSECYGKKDLSVENHLQKYNGELNFNSLHIYSGANQNDPWHPPGYGYSCGGSFGEDVEEYDDEYFIPLCDLVSGAGIKGIYGRAKIEMPCYFQRVEYEIQRSDPQYPGRINYGFCYDYNLPDAYEEINGRTVLHAKVGVDQPCRYICYNIYENTQHSDFFDWQWSDAIDWRIRPLMRIDSNYVDQHPDEKVVRIDIIRYNGAFKDSIIIRARDFARNNNINNLIYGGQYIDSLNFYFEQAQGIKLQIFGYKDNTGLNEGRYNSPTNNVDFRVFWYGNTDVWFDKLTVLDYYAEKLFSGDYDNKIQAETNAFTGDNLFSYFADEIPFSCLRSVKYVRDKMREVKPDSRFYFAVTNYFSNVGLKNPIVFFEALKDIVNPECFTIDAHEVNGKVPPVYNDISSMNVPLEWRSSNYEDYNLFVQNRLLGDRNSICPTNTWPYNYHLPSVTGSLIYQTCLARTYADLCTPKSYLFVQPQIQSFMLKYVNGNYDWNREPTNEEIRVQANVSLVHGADGLSWFLYQSLSYHYNTSSSDIAYSLNEHDCPSTPVDSLINVGMLKLNSPDRRYLNYYNQNKWQFVGDMNQVFLNWKPTLDNVNWIAGFSTHTEGTNRYYINDIVSIHRNPAYYFIYDTVCTNCDETKYWEMGFFEKRSGVTGEDYSKYFLMVNRRTVPDMNQDGDYRVLRIKFNNNYLSDFKNWKLIDVNTNQHIEFSSDASTYIYLDSLGYFQPGEGKLFKLAPVLQEGGTLVANENWWRKVMSGEYMKYYEKNYTN